MTDFIDQLPKAELHCHSDGLLDPEMLRALSGAGGGFESFAAELESIYPVSSVDQWLKAYDPLRRKFLDPVAERLPLLVRAQVERWRLQNVQYAELFVGRVLLISDVGALVECFRTLRAQIDSIENGPAVNLVICVGRHSYEKLANRMARILALANAGLISGISLAGDELACSVKSLQECFAQFHDHGLGVEIHAGEFGGAESVRDALDFGRPRRLGHGVRAFDDPSLVERLVKDRIHVEFCPTSNLRLGVIEAIEQLPIRQALEAGIEFSINTDDPGAFQCSLTSELRLVSEAFGLTQNDLQRIFRDSVRAGFQAGRRRRVAR